MASQRPRSIGRLLIDSTHATTELCLLGQATGTDKTPLNSNGGHRHPYTAVYTMLLSQYKNTPVRFVEIGIAGGASVVMWDHYFKNPGAELHFFDCGEEFLKHARGGIAGPKAKFSFMDVSKDGDVLRALKESSKWGQPYDVILDDSSHNFEHQMRIVREGWSMLRQGGMFIIEDVFRAESEERYEKGLAEILPQCAAAYFVVCEHAARWSPGWDNDKLLILVKG